MLVQSGDIASWKAGMYGKNFQCRTEKLDLCSSLCSCGMCLGVGPFIASLPGTQLGWQRGIIGSYPSIVLACSQGDGGTSSPANSHIVSLFPSESCVLVDSCKVGFYASTKVSLKILYYSEKGWHQQLVDLFSSTPVIFLSLSFFPGVNTDKSLPEIFRSAFSSGFCEFPCK